MKTILEVYHYFFESSDYISYIKMNIQKDKNWLIMLLIGIILSMLPYLSFDRREINSHVSSENIIIEYVVIILQFFIFITFVKNILLKAKEEHILYSDTKNRTGNDFNMADYIWYRTDYLFSYSKSFKFYILLSFTISLIICGGVLWLFVSNQTLHDSIWTAWTFIADPGTHSETVGALRRIVALLMTLGGMVLFAMVIGIISEEIGSFVENLKKGKSRVVESGHTLIIGQGDKLLPTIEQICLANESEGGGVIVILTTNPKEELEDVLLTTPLKLRGTKVIVRSGQAHLHSHLHRVCAVGAKSIIILADRSLSDPDMTDVNTVRIVMSLRGLNAPKTGHIVCEVCDIDNEELITLVGLEHVETVVSHDIVGRLMIQCAREQGLASVLSELLGFEGAEFYISDWGDRLVGKTFGEVSLLFKDAIVIGIYHDPDNLNQENTSHKWNDTAPPSYQRLFPHLIAADHQFRDTSSLRYTNIALRMNINPHDDTVFHRGDQVIVIAEDNDTYEPCSDDERLVVDSDRLNRNASIGIREVQKTERMLFVGWRRDMDDMVLQVDDYVSKGSQLTLYSQVAMSDRESRLMAGGLEESMLKNVELIHLVGSTTSRKDLDALPLETYDSILILADEELESSTVQFDMLYADSKSLTCLILIKDIKQCILDEVEQLQGKLLREAEGENPEELEGSFMSEDMTEDLHRNAFHTTSVSNANIHKEPHTSESEVILLGEDDDSTYDSDIEIKQLDKSMNDTNHGNKISDMESKIDTDEKNVDKELAKAKKERDRKQRKIDTLNLIFGNNVHDKDNRREGKYNKSNSHENGLSRNNSFPVASNSNWDDEMLINRQRNSTNASFHGYYKRVQSSTPTLTQRLHNTYYSYARNAALNLDTDRVSLEHVGDDVSDLFYDVDNEVPRDSVEEVNTTNIGVSTNNSVNGVKISDALNPNANTPTSRKTLRRPSMSDPVNANVSHSVHGMKSNSIGNGRPPVLSVSSSNTSNGHNTPAVKRNTYPMPSESKPSSKTKANSFTNACSNCQASLNLGSSNNATHIGAHGIKRVNPFAHMKRSNRTRHSAIISEILDSRTKNVVSKALDSDFVLSNELISMAVAMVSEQREVNCLLKELFSGKGNELHINHADEYVLIDSYLTFVEIMAIARRKGEIAIGYTERGKVIINPSSKMNCILWHADMKIIVIKNHKVN